jgi:hypothetical protein
MADHAIQLSGSEMAEHTHNDIIAVSARARPTRVALLINPLDISSEELDELIHTCSTYWGGGYWPIVPTDGESVSDDWWTVLKAVDPDIIIHAVPIAPPLLDRVHRQLAPAKVEQLRRVSDTAGSHLLFPTLNAIDCYETLAFRAERRPRLQDVAFLALRDSPAPADIRRFALHNFGLLRRSSLTDQLFRSNYATTHIVNSVSATDLLQWFLATSGELIVPKDLGIFSAPRPLKTTYRQPYSDFVLVVGQSCSELLYVWNRALLTSGYQGRDALWLESTWLDDEEFMKVVGSWIQRCYWTSQQPRGTVLSYSVDNASLDKVALRLRELTKMYWDTARLASDAFPALLEPPWGTEYRDSWEQAPATIEHVALSAKARLASPTGLLRLPRPPFASDRHRTDGWMVDLDFECTLDPRRYDNLADRWRLPRRANLATLFARGRALARVQWQHKPSVSVRADESSLEVTVPDKARLLHTLLKPLPGTRSINARTGEVDPKFVDFTTSEQGRRYQAVIALLDSLHSAGRLFDDLFWRTVLLDAIGKPGGDVDRLASTVQREMAPLFAAFAAEPATASVESRLQAIRFDTAARKVASAMHRVAPRPKTLTRTVLEARFGQLSTEYIRAEGGNRKARFRDDAERDLEWLVAAGALLQGVVVTCPRCGTVQWRGVEDLGPTLRCGDCTSAFPLPLDPPWEYQISGLLRNAVVQYGVLPLLHATWRLLDGASVTAIAIPPQELRLAYDGPVATDLDIIAIRDGSFTIGEVKSHPKGFNLEQLAVLEEVAREVRPDTVLLAASGSEWPADVSDHIEAFTRRLRLIDVEVKAWLLEW